MKTRETIGATDCTIYSAEGADVLLLQPVDDHDQTLLDSEVELIQNLSNTPFNLVAFDVKDWMSELTPWTAPPTFGRQPFGDGAEETLRKIEHELLPALELRYGATTTILGGYSLAGLFSLWAGYNTDLFDGIASASPSVWYPHWTDFIEREKMQSKAVYLSLGDRESRTKNPVMAHVDDALRLQHQLISSQGIETTIEWNAGGHFVDSEKRMAKGFAWCCRAISRSRQ